MEEQIGREDSGEGERECVVLGRQQASGYCVSESNVIRNFSISKKKVGER
jgi:hypothetical protein